MYLIVFVEICEMNPFSVDEFSVVFDWNENVI